MSTNETQMQVSLMNAADTLMSNYENGTAAKVVKPVAKIFVAAIMAGMFNGSVLIRILSYIPLISAILSPSLLVLGQIGVIDYIISCILVILFNYILVKYGLRIYKVGI